MPGFWYLLLGVVGISQKVSRRYEVNVLALYVLECGPAFSAFLQILFSYLDVDLYLVHFGIGISVLMLSTHKDTVQIILV